ncbi:MAG: T9SS type A sorting domain-containing protein [Crocinitomicaceae bacterium]
MWKLTSLISLTVVLLTSFSTHAQFNWTWTELDTMPFRTANNAVCEAIVNGEEFVYSFGGIDTTKEYTGIHQRSFKYEVATDTWTEIAPLPDTLGKIAKGASFVNGKIYVIGGYHVFANGNEISSDRVHIYDPATDTYETDGAAIPVAIDDHVQAVYKDSLIFVVTGWSNNANKAEVQIYDTYLDQWQQATEVPNNNFFKAFGASGAIIGDTLYYHGGVSGSFAFAARKFMRKGYINPTDPTDVTWEQMEDAPGEAGYRAACSSAGNTIFWIGGAPVAYNYNGIAYDGSGGVDPSARVLHFSLHDYQYNDEVSEPYGVMDLRGIAKLSNNRWIICGGMDTNQVVSNRTFLLENPSVELDELSIPEGYEIAYQSNEVIIRTPELGVAFLYDASGREVRAWKVKKNYSLNVDEFETGIYFFKYQSTQGEVTLRILL